LTARFGGPFDAGEMACGPRAISSRAAMPSAVASANGAAGGTRIQSSEERIPSSAAVAGVPDFFDRGEPQC